MDEKTYRIGEAAAKLHLKTYVLRFWEMEFPQIAPLRTEKGQRLYTEQDITLLRRIRCLLHERGLTIEGARRILREEVARGAVYRDTELALDDNDGAFPADSGRAATTAKPGGKTESARSTPPTIASEQANLFASNNRDGASLPSMETASITAELMAIHRLLTAGFSGDAP